MAVERRMREGRRYRRLLGRAVRGGRIIGNPMHLEVQGDGVGGLAPASLRLLFFTELGKEEPDPFGIRTLDGVLRAEVEVVAEPHDETGAILVRYPVLIEDGGVLLDELVGQLDHDSLRLQLFTDYGNALIFQL